MPAAAVIPAPIAYIKVVAVKKLVVGFVVATVVPILWVLSVAAIFGWNLCGIRLSCRGCPSFTVKKSERSNRLMPLNVLAWNNKIRLRYYFVGLRTEVMINRDGWGYSYSIARGEILGFLEDELLRKHLPRMFSLIKNES